MSKPPTYTFRPSFFGSMYYARGKSQAFLCAEGIHDFFYLPVRYNGDIDVVFLKQATPNSVAIEIGHYWAEIDGQSVALQLRAKNILLHHIRQGYKHVEIRYWQEARR